MKDRLAIDISNAIKDVDNLRHNLATGMPSPSKRAKWIKELIPAEEKERELLNHVNDPDE